MKSITEIHMALPNARNEPPVKNPLTCADGFTMSVQASHFHYCEPRKDRGPHTKFEVGFPSEVEPLLMDYAENPDDPTQTVYGWVPADIVDQVIAKHGGIKEDV